MQCYLQAPSIDTLDDLQIVVMRILSFIVKVLIGGAVLVGIGFFVSREVLLQIAISQLKSDTAQMRSIARNTGAYIQNCQRQGTTGISGQFIDAIQLRFISDTEYVVEVVCSELRITPIEVLSNSLPMMVEKVPGSSGLTWGVEPSAVSLAIWGRQRSLGIEEESIVPALSPAEVGTAMAPPTSCEGFGYTCCQQELTIGTGELISRAQDCPQTCYQQCQDRPIVLSVTTQPFYDQATRTVTVQRGQPLQAGFVIDAQGLENVATTLNFGDGATQNFTEINGTASHTYQCSAPSCTYTLSVSAEDSSGISSAQTPLSQIKVVVQ